MAPPPAGPQSTQLDPTTPSSTLVAAENTSHLAKTASLFPPIHQGGLFRKEEGQRREELWLVPLSLGGALWGPAVLMSGLPEGSLERFPFATGGESAVLPIA